MSLNVFLYVEASLIIFFPETGSHHVRILLPRQAGLWEPVKAPGASPSQGHALLLRPASNSALHLSLPLSLGLQEHLTIRGLYEGLEIERKPPTWSQPAEHSMLAVHIPGLGSLLSLCFSSGS